MFDLKAVVDKSYNDKYTFVIYLHKEYNIPVSSGLLDIWMTQKVFARPVCCYFILYIYINWAKFPHFSKNSHNSFQASISNDDHVAPAPWLRSWIICHRRKISIKFCKNHSPQSKVEMPGNTHTHTHICIYIYKYPLTV